ncbi:MAG: sulfurtransferase TusA family protein [Anaerobacillus sp.]|uniref:sulfurtransferase TusA family protein n=1 Tax=Anaerobacillus sp. TaxID=1872506 RepID=UPI00391AC866
MIKINNKGQIDVVYDAGEAGCGELIMNVFLNVKKMQKGEIIHVISYDLGAKEDIPAWCRMQGHSLLEVFEEGLLITHFVIQKN